MKIMNVNNNTNCKNNQPIFRGQINGSLITKPEQDLKILEQLANLPKEYVDTLMMSGKDMLTFTPNHTLTHIVADDHIIIKPKTEEPEEFLKIFPKGTFQWYLNLKGASKEVIEKADAFAQNLILKRNKNNGIY